MESSLHRSEESIELTEEEIYNLMIKQSQRIHLWDMHQE